MERRRYHVAFDFSCDNASTHRVLVMLGLLVLRVPFNELGVRCQQISQIAQGRWPQGGSIAPSSHRLESVNATRCSCEFVAVARAARAEIRAAGPRCSEEAMLRWKIAAVGEVATQNIDTTRTPRLRWRLTGAVTMGTMAADEARRRGRPAQYRRAARSPSRKQSQRAVLPVQPAAAQRP